MRITGTEGAGAGSVTKTGTVGAVAAGAGAGAAATGVAGALAALAALPFTACQPGKMSSVPARMRAGSVMRLATAMSACRTP